MKSKPVMIIVSTLVLMAAISFFFIKPVVGTVWNAWKSLEQSKKDLAEVQEQKTIIAELQSNPQIQNIASIALKYIPKESESGQLVIELTAIADTNKLTVDQTSMEQKSTAQKTDQDPTSGVKTTSTPSPRTSTSAQPSAAKELQFTLTVSGTYADFLNFLKAVDTSSRLISLKMLTIQKNNTASAPAEAASTPTFKFLITGVSYYKADVSVEKNKNNLKVSESTIQKFLNLKSYGLPINLTTEAGFGRANPFENY